jgi:hypothetical protein
MFILVIELFHEQVVVALLIPIAFCEEFLHTFHMKICIHKIHLGVELLCSCILTN